MRPRVSRQLDDRRVGVEPLLLRHLEQSPVLRAAAATVIAMRTAAASRVALVQGWSGIAITSETGVFALDAAPSRGAETPG